MSEPTRLAMRPCLHDKALVLMKSSTIAPAFGEAKTPNDGAVTPFSCSSHEKKCRMERRSSAAVDVATALPVR